MNKEAVKFETIKLLEVKIFCCLDCDDNWRIQNSVFSFLNLNFRYNILYCAVFKRCFCG